MYLGIDLGTSAVKVVLADADGKIILSASESYPLFIPREGWSEQNPEDWVCACKKCLQSLQAKIPLDTVAGISFCGQMHGLVCLDKNDNVIRPAILWNDQRTSDAVDYLNRQIGIERLVKETGNRAVTGFTAPKLLWFRENEPQNFQRIAKIMLPKDYLAYVMSGVFATDVSDASGTLFFDVENRKWSTFMLDIIGVTENQLPQVYESYQAIGTIKPDMATECGIALDAKIIIGGGDQAVGAVGTGTVDDRATFISLGTSGVVFVAEEEYHKDNQGSLHSFAHANGKYHFMGVTLSAGASLNWWSDICKENDFAKLMNETHGKDIDDLLFMPYMSGERSPINAPFVKGSFFGLTLAHDRASMTKAVIEGICFSLKDCLRVVNGAGIFPKHARVIGGGSKSPEWMQILADVMGIEIATINTADGGALGSVILAMTGCGKFASVDEGCKRLIKEQRVFYPSTERNKQYEAKYLQYRKLSELICQWYS